MLNKRFFLISGLFLIAGYLVLFAVDDRGYKVVAKLVIIASLIVPATAVAIQKMTGVSNTKIILTNVMLLYSTVIVLTITAEYFVRFFYSDITTTNDNSSYFARNWREANKPTINSLGFREREISEQKPSGVYRIAVVGDSFTYGQGINDSDRFSSIIERRLNNIGNRYEVYNFGKPGAETIDHIQFLDEVFKISPDFVLLQWFVNDVEGHDKSARPSSYRLIPSEYLSNYLHKHSALYFLINRQWKALQRQFGLVGSYEASMNARFGDIESDDSQRSIRELAEFIKRVKDKNIDLGIVMFPMPVPSEGDGDIGIYPFGYLFDRVAEACQYNEINCIDMRKVYAKERSQDLQVNTFDGHPNAFANQLAADIILQSFMDEWQSKNTSN